MNESGFLRALERLNSGQRAAVEEIEGPVMVVAGPGTGKTQVLTVRIANILEKTQVDPENILALTFTESAAQNMRSRLSEMIGTLAYRVEISTFHGFANKIIQSYPEEFPGLVGAEAITELEQIRIIEELVTNEDLNYLRPFGDPLYYVRSIIGSINELKREGVTVSKFEEAVNEQRKNLETVDDLYHEKGAYKGQKKNKYVELERAIEKNAELLRVFRRYQEKLAVARYYDFSDMLIEVLSVMEKKGGLLSGLQERYQYILVDEHQDTNGAQNKIVELLASFFAPNPNLFVVGDEKQAIFRFQGATIENFLYFKKLYPNAKLINLTENYRSTQRILDAAGSLIRQNSAVDLMVEKGGFLESRQSYPDEKIRVVEMNEEWVEYEWLGDLIQQTIKNGVRAEEVAVIVRQNKDFEEITRILSRRGIRFSVSSNQDVLTDKWVDQLMVILRAINSYDYSVKSNSDWLVTKVLHLNIFGIDATTVYKLLRERANRRISMIELLDDREGLKKLKLKDIDQVLGTADSLCKWVKMAHNDTLDDLFVSIFEESGIRESVVCAANNFEVLGKFRAVFDDLKNQLSKNKKMSLADYVRYLDLLNEHHLGIENKSEIVTAGSVQLMTAHKAKGLEFEVVMMPGVVEGHWGSTRKRGSLFKLPWHELGVKLLTDVEVSELDDERRLFYVGLTRAKKQIWVSYSKLSKEGREQLPCQFISEIDPKHVEKIDTSGIEQKLSEHPEVVLSRQNEVRNEDKEYVRALFLEQGLSATSLDNYLKCPWHYFYRNLLRLPDVKNKSMVFGTAVHAAINKYIDAIKLGDRLDLETVQQIAINCLDREVLTETERKDLLKKCRVAIDIFYEQRMTKWDNRRESELRVRGVKLTDEVTINGVIDMLEPIDGNHSLIRVTDFKTGRVKSRNEISKEDGEYNYERQLKFYKLLLDNYQYKKLKVKTGVIDFVEADSKGLLHREEFEISDESVNDLKKLIIGVATEILELKFWDRYCGNEDCEYCGLRRLASLSSEVSAVG